MAKAKAKPTSAGDERTSSAKIESYRPPQLFVAGTSAKLVRGKAVNAQYKDTSNDWYNPWPKGPNNPD